MRTVPQWSRFRRLQSNGGWSKNITLCTVLLGISSNCSSFNPDVHVRRMPDNHLQVQGPLAGPYKTLEQLALNACEIMTRQPGSTNGLHGFEYCALYYHSAAQDEYFLSYLSDIGRNYPDGTKSCELPRYLDDPKHQDAVILGPSHNHPHNRRFSRKDLSKSARQHPTRIFDKSTGKIWHRSTLLFYKQEGSDCEAYLFNNVTLSVSALRNGEWEDIGIVYNDDGDIRMMEGKDWSP
jgi:hypothetical protein